MKILTHGCSDVQYAKKKATAEDMRLASLSIIFLMHLFVVRAL